MIQFRAHAFFRPMHLLHSNSQAHTHTPCPFPSTRAMLPSIVRRVDRGHASWIARITPLWPPHRSLQDNNLDDQAKQAIKDAAESGIEIQF